MDSRICQTSTASPAKPGELSCLFSNLRKEAALALGEIGAPEALPALEQIQGDPDPEVRKSARLSIAQIRAADEQTGKAHEKLKAGL